MLLLTLVFIPLKFFLGAEYLFCLSEQGNAYITCMPGPVRRWNYPVPLCLGNGWIYGHCLYFRQQTHRVASDGPSPLLVNSFIVCVLGFKAVCLLLNQSQYLAPTNKPPHYTFSFFLFSLVYNSVHHLTTDWPESHSVPWYFSFEPKYSATWP